MVDLPTLEEKLRSHFEWLAVRENGRTMPLRVDEIELDADAARPRIGFVWETGFVTMRIAEFTEEDDAIALKLTSAAGGKMETLRLVPRESAGALAASIEIARLQRANQIAEGIRRSFAGLKPKRVSLNSGNSRLAKIELADGREQLGFIADVTSTITHEGLLAAALDWLEQVRHRKRAPIQEVTIVAEKRPARDLQRLLALVDAGTRRSMRVAELIANDDELSVKMLRELVPSDLWREKPAKLHLPPVIEVSETARSIVAHAPDKIDVIVSKHGETLRFNGLPFVRVRRLLGKEMAWYGTGRERKLLTDATREDFHDLLEDLHRHRDAEQGEKRHDLFRLRSEAWLESILKRNIKQLDANLILSPIFNQFRASTDKIDLLALRRDGRLVVIEIKTSPDRDAIFQAADYWRKIELQRRKGVLQRARLFGDLEIKDEPAMIYIVAPALHFHFDHERFARMLNRDIELWRWELHEAWRKEIKVIRRLNFINIDPVGSFE